ncbi:MAG: MBL fold metallo-hydrolase [Oscillospiraceae bacterium]|nr:MBL fold metallo-hydrolase [Oscillospiraceae bacterium]
MKLSVFASGSTGNCALLSQGDTHLLLDDGISLRRLRAALALRELTPEQLGGVLITHEHKDHISGLPMLAKHCGVPLFAPRTVANHIRWSAAGVDGYIREIIPGVPFEVGTLTVTAFPTSHDTDQSVGYRIRGDADFSLCTDTGCVTPEMMAALSGSAAAIIEANHDVDMLRAGPYPWYLKRRILSERGHLSNGDSAALCCELARSGLRTLVLGHLSRENNRPSLAERTVGDALQQAGQDVALHIAPEWGHLCLEF